MERLLDVVPQPDEVAARDADKQPPGVGGGRLLGPAHQLRDVEKRALLAALPRLFSGGEAAICGGWSEEGVRQALLARRAQVFHRATLGPGDGAVFSRTYGRQRTRDTCHVKVRWEVAGVPLAHICAVQYYVMLHAEPGGAAALPPVRVALVKAHRATAAGGDAGALWCADASAPEEGGTLWPVLLEQIDCKLLIASPGGDSTKGELFGTEYTCLSRAA